jgi:trigger factor
MIGSPNYVRFVYDGDGSTAFGAAGPGGLGADRGRLRGLLRRARPGVRADQQISFRSDYAAFFDFGIPFGGLFTGAEGIKTPSRRRSTAARPGIAYDPCYHLACDTFDNVNLEVLDLNADAVAYATLQYAMNTSEVNGERGKGNFSRAGSSPAPRTIAASPALAAPFCGEGPPRPPPCPAARVGYQPDRYRPWRARQRRRIMDAQIVEKNAVHATLKVTVPSDKVDAAFDRVLATLSRQMRVPGFRPGRAPRGVLIRRIGEEALAEEVRDALVDEAYPQAVRQLELSPVHAHFHADAPVQGQDFAFEVHAELYPEVTLPDLTTISVETRRREVDDAMVADAIAQLKRENATLVPVDRGIEPTDWVLLESLPQATDDEAAEAEGVEGADAGAQVDAVANAETSAAEAPTDDEPSGSTFPVDLDTAGDELRDQLLGAGIGAVVELKLTDDVTRDEEGNPTIRTMRVKVRDVKAKELPEEGEEFAQQLGVDDWDEVEKRVRESLASQLEREGYDQQRDELITKLMDGATLELPPSLVNRRKRNLLEDLVEDLKRQGVTLERYLQRLEERGTKEEFEQELDEAAQRGVRRDLVLERLLEERGTTVEDAELDAAVKHLAAQRRQDVGRFVQEMGEDWLANYRFLLARDKAVRDLLTELTGEPAPGMRPDEAQGAAEAATAAMEDDLEDDDIGDGEDGHGHEHHEHDDHDHHDHDHEREPEEGDEEPKHDG